MIYLRAIAGFFSLIPGWVWAILLAGSLAHGCTTGLQRDKARNDYAKLNSAIASERLIAAETTRRAELAQRTEETRRQKEKDDVVRKAKSQIAAATADAGRADRAAVSLRDRVAQLEQSARRACTNPAAGPGSTPTDPAIFMLADLFSRADETSGAMAKYADSARIAGEACQRQYDALTR